MNSASAPLVPPPTLAPTLGDTLLVNGMLLCWALALVIAIWGSIREARRVDQERRRTDTDHDGSPTPGLEGVLEHWGLWCIGLLAAGFVLLTVFSRVVHL